MIVARGRGALGWPILVALAAVAVYANTFSAGFALDDVNIVENNPRIRSLGAVPSLFATPYWPDAQGRAAGLYRPVTMSTLALNRALAGPGATSFHVVNALLHAVASLLAWFAFRRAGALAGAATLGALLFAVHPIHAEAVANIVGRAELLAAIGVLGAWLAHRRAVEAPATAPGAAWAGASALLYLGAVLAKETAVAAPLLFLADDLSRPRSHPESRVPGTRCVRFGVYAGYVTVLAVVAALRVAVLGGFGRAADVAFIDNPAAFAGAGPRIATALWTQVRYVGLLLWPATLSSDYSFNAIPTVHSATDLRLAAGLALVMAVAVLAAYGWKRSRPLWLGMGLWVVFFVPTANVLFPSGTLMAERLAYLPSLGACLILGRLGARAARAPAGVAWRRSTRAIAVTALAAAAVVALASRTWLRNPVWRDNSTLALHDVEVMPDSAKLQAGAGIFLARQGEPRRAEEHFEKALAIYPDYAQTHYNLGILLARRGATVKALAHLLRSATLSANPRPLEAAAGLLGTGEPIPEDRDGALARMAADAPETIPGRLALALLAEARGDRAEASARYAALLSDPDLTAPIRNALRRRPVSRD